MNLDSSFPQFYETGLEDLCGYAVLREGMKALFPNKEKSTNGKQPQ
nr:MAG TPA: hypothetical protein [Caudoviricetes sp.]